MRFYIDGIKIDRELVTNKAVVKKAKELWHTYGREMSLRQGNRIVGMVWQDGSLPRLKTTFGVEEIL